MKSIERTVLAVLVLAIAALFYFQFSATTDLAYVDNARLLSGYQGMIDAQAAYRQKATGWQANIDTLTNELRQQIAAYEQESTAMTDQERTLAQELIRTRQKQLANYQQSVQSQSDQEDEKMTTEVLTTINAFITQYGEAKGYKIILGATNQGNILYAREGTDITEEVLKALNQDYAGQ